MTVKDLKNKIESNTLNDDVLILKYSDNSFLSNQYVNAICKIKNKERINIELLNEMDTSNIFGVPDDVLYVLIVDKVDFYVSDKLKNLIIICKEVTVNIPVDFIDMTKVVSWQIEDFVKMRLPGLNDIERKWLCDITKYDIYRLDNECKKLEIFNKSSQEILFKEINDDNGYDDLNPMTIFNLTNNLIKKDYKELNEILKGIKYIDIEAIGLVTVLLKNIKNLIDIQINPRNTAQSLNMTPKQFAAIKYNVGKFKNEQLINIYEFLTNIDYKLKSGFLQLDSDAKNNNLKLIDYIILNFIQLGR